METDSDLKWTPIADDHIARGARMVGFGGWYMPVQYTGINEEHRHTRTKVGLFDVSHMGEIWFRGPQALPTLQWLTTNDVSQLAAGEAHYSLLPNDQGGLVDDIIIYCVKPQAEYLVCVNAANIAKDYAWMVQHNKGAEITNESDQWGQIAVQGPEGRALLARVLGPETLKLEPFQFRSFPYGGQQVLLARTGYTGEDGGEVFVPKSLTLRLWTELIEKGSDYPALPIGLGARDTLRLEMKYSLYGHEITDTTHPFEAKLGWVVKLDKGDFIGREPMMKAKALGNQRELVGFKLTDRGVAREGYPIAADGHEIGSVTSGTMSPSLGYSIGVGYVEKKHAAVGSVLDIMIRGKPTKAVVVKTPFMVVPKRST
jgi:aminomethyltransferase